MSATRDKPKGGPPRPAPDRGGEGSRQGRWGARAARAACLVAALAAATFARHRVEVRAAPASATPSPPAAPASEAGWRVSTLSDGSLRAESGGAALVVRAERRAGAERGAIEIGRGPEGPAGGQFGFHLRFGGEEAAGEWGPLERLPLPGLARLPLRPRGPRGPIAGYLRYTFEAGPSAIVVSWEGEGPAPGGGVPTLAARMHAPRALLFVDQAGLVRDATRAGQAAALVTDGGALGFGPGLFSHYEESGEAHALVPLPTRLEIGAAAPLVEALYAQGGRAVRYAGRTEPPSEGVAIVAAVGGRIAGAAFSRADGSFSLAAPAGPAELFASVAGERAGPSLSPPEGAGAIVAPVAPLGRLRARVLDADTGERLPARVVVHAVEGAREPNFGPHFRAGAGSFVDVEGGEFVTPLPAGTYRLLATRGLAYTIDEARVVVGRGEFVEVDLELRRVLETPDWASCDLHVHARPSFDSLVSVEDRLRTLAAAGVEFAVPSEHNHVGDYSAARELGIEGRLSWVPGVEVTTIGPSIGHFNVYPWREKKAPPHRHVQAQDIVRHVRERHPDSLLQINHPRLAKFIGYFDIVGLDRASTSSRAPIALGFDTVEVYNGFDLNSRARVEAVMRDWLRLFEAGLPLWATASSDSHSVQYTAAGYPRTYVSLKPAAAPAGPSGPDTIEGAAPDDTEGAAGTVEGEGSESGKSRHEPGAPDVERVLEGLRRGRALLTSGPFIELSHEGRGPGEHVHVQNGSLRVRVRVLAAPWVDTTELEIFVGSKSVLRRPLPARPLRHGPPSASAEDERREAVRFDEELEVPAAPPARTLVAVVRGERGVGDVLPYMNFQPLAITNPLVLEHEEKR